MSYCVNCGVKLEQSLKTCPLCHTPVINPNEIKNIEQKENFTPFAETKGEVEPMTKKDGALWLTIVFFSTAITCLILNFTLFQHNLWSIPVSGACTLLWIFFCPRMFSNKMPLYLNLIQSAVGIILYEYVLTFLTTSDRWFYELALPITLFALILLGIFCFLYIFISKSLLSTVFYFFVEVGLFCIEIERFIDQFRGAPLEIGWSAIVFSVCAVISIALIAIMSIRRLRNAVRRRLHF